MQFRKRKGLLGVFGILAVVIVLTPSLALAEDSIVEYGESYTDGSTIFFAETSGSCHTWNPGMTFSFSLTVVGDAMNLSQALIASYTVDVYIWTGSRGGWLGGGSYNLNVNPGTKTIVPGAIVVGPITYAGWNGNGASCSFEVFRTVTVTSPPPGGFGSKSVLY